MFEHKQKMDHAVKQLNENKTENKMVSNYQALKLFFI